MRKCHVEKRKNRQYWDRGHTIWLPSDKNACKVACVQVPADAATSGSSVCLCWCCLLYCIHSHKCPVICCVLLEFHHVAEMEYNAPSNLVYKMVISFQDLMFLFVVVFFSPLK